MMKFRFAGLPLFAATLAHAGDHFVVVPFDSLKFEGEPPALQSPSGVARWSNGSVVYEPRFVLDQGGEVCFEYDAQNAWQQWPNRPSRVAFRVSQVGPIHGRMIAVGADAKPSIARFTLDDAAETPEVANQFLAIAEEHYDRFAQGSLPGAAWFRHRALAAHAARGAAPSAEPAPLQTGPWSRTHGGFDDTFELFTGARALAENLDLDRALRAVASEPATIPIETLSGVTTRALDWKKLTQGMKPELDPLAQFVPIDQHAIFFPSFEALERVFDEIDRSTTPVLSFANATAEDQLTKERYPAQLCFAMSSFARAFGPTVVDSVALTGNDPFLPSGSGLALIVKCKQVDVLEKYLALRRTEAQVKGAKSVEGSVGKAKYVGVRTDDRRISSYSARFDDVVVIANSALELEHVAAAIEGRTPSLTGADEYLWFRDRYRRSEPSESAFIVLTDATIRRWAGPRSRIAESRRTRAAAAMAEIEARKLDARVRGEPLSGSAAAADLAISSDFVWKNDHVESPTWGTLTFLTPISEIDVSKVTASEKTAYENFRQGFQNRWRAYFDPVALRLAFDDARLAADLTVMPLALGSEYNDLRDLAGTAKLGAGSGDPHDGSLFHYAMAFSSASRPARSIGDFAGPYAQQLGADPLGWIGAVSVFADRDPFWDELTRAQDASKFLEDNFYKLPVAFVADVKDPLKLAAFLTALRATVDGAGPGMTKWSTKTWKEQPYVAVALGDGFQTSDALAEAAAYYAAMPDEFILSLREDVVQRAIERRLARKAAPQARPTWLGESAGLSVERDGVDRVLLIADRETSESLAVAAWSALPILDELHALDPAQDSPELFERLFGTRLVSPGGGKYVWNAELGSFEASDYGSPWSPKHGPAVPDALARLVRAQFGLTFENDGLRARAALERNAK